MASPLVSKAPRCFVCVRQILGAPNGCLLQSYGQIRGKKKLAKVTTVNARLLQKMPSYGRKGAIVPVTKGLMRNIWFPKRMAEYVTDANLEELGIKGMTIERDYTFGLERAGPQGNAVQAGISQIRPASNSDSSSTITKASDLVSQASEDLAKLIPENITFYRAPISTTKISPSIPTTSSLSSENTEKASIYGSVSTADVVAEIRAMLSHKSLEIPILLSPQDVTFLDAVDEKDRIKHLGNYSVEINLKGAARPVRKIVSILPEQL